MKNHTIRMEQVLTDEVEGLHLNRGWSGTLWTETETYPTEGQLQQLEDARLANSLGVITMETLPQILLTAMANLNRNPTPEGFRDFGATVGQEMAALARQLIDMTADRDALIRWVNNAVTVARDYTERHEGCSGGKSQFLADMGIEQLEKEYVITVVATQDVTITAADEDDALKQLSTDHCSHYNWDIDTSACTVEEA